MFSRIKTDELPGPAENEGILHGDQRTQLRTLGVMVLATVLTPYNTPTVTLSSQQDPMLW